MSRGGVTIQEFVATRVEMTPDEYEASELGEGLSMDCYSSVERMLVYADSVFIELLKDGKYQLTLGSYSESGDNLGGFEQRLYQYAIESGLIQPPACADRTDDTAEVVS